MRLFSAMVVAAGIMAAPIHAAESETLLVGKTDIFCVQAPCPWRGIRAADAQQTGPARLLWSAQTLPPLNADDEHASRIREAWNSDLCLSIQGKMMGGRLYVDSIEGTCP